MIIFGKFGDGRSKEDRAVQVRATTGYGTDGVGPLHSGSLTRATDLFCTPSVCGAGNEGSPAPATHCGTARMGIFHSRRFTRTSFRLPHPGPISNRELDLLERDLSHCKQRAAAVSNRELPTIRNFAHSPMFVRHQVAVLPRGARIACRGSRPLPPFLTGTASHTEIGVTHSKQTTGEFLTGARIAQLESAAQQVRP